MKRLRTSDRVALAGLALLPFVWYAAPLFTDSCYYLGDLIGQYHSWWTYGHESLREGRFPLWNPYVLGGMPYHVNPENSLFYPLKLPLVFLSFFRGAALLRALDTIVASTGGFVLLRVLGLRRVSAVLGALMFGYGSFLSYEFIHVPYVNTAVWFPWQLLCVERLTARPAVSRALLLALVTACSFLGGSPGIFVIVQMTAGLFLAGRLLRLGLGRRRRSIVRVLGLLALAAGAFTVLTAVLLWPAWDFVALTPRAGGLAASRTFGESAMTVDELRVLAFPWLHLRYGAPYPPLYPIPFLFVPYVGAGAVLLALFVLRSPRHVQLLPPALSAAAFGVLMSLGNGGAFFPRVLAHVPWLRWFRWPHDYLLMVYLVLWILAAAGFDALWRANGRRLRRFGPIVLAYLLAAAWLAPCRETLLAAILACSLVALGWLACRGTAARWRPMSARAAAALVPALALGDLAVYGSGLRTYLPRDQVELRPMREVAEWIRRRGAIDRVAVSAPSAGAHLRGRERVFGRSVPLLEGPIPPRNRAGTALDRWLLRLETPEVAARLWARRGAFDDLDETHWTYPVNASMVFRYQEIAGYDPFAVDRVLRLFRTLPYDRAWDLFGVRWVVTPHRVALDRLEPAALVAGLHVYRNTGALPRVSVPAYATDRVSDDEAVERLSLASFDPREEVVFEERLSPPCAARSRGRAGTAAIVGYEPEHVRVRAELDRAGFVVLHDVFHPGWKARVDGREAPLLRANYVFRAVRLAPGTHTVEFVYRPRSFVIGAWISGAGWVGLLVALVLAPRSHASRFPRRSRAAPALEEAGAAGPPPGIPGAPSWARPVGAAGSPGRPTGFRDGAGPACRRERAGRRLGRPVPASWLGAAAFAAACLWVAARAPGGDGSGVAAGGDPPVIEGPSLRSCLRPGTGWSTLPDGVRLHEDVDVAFSAATGAGGATPVWVVARGRPLGEVWPLLALDVDGRERAAFHVTSEAWGVYRLDVELSPGEHRFRLRFANDRSRYPDDRDVDLQLVGVGGSLSRADRPARWAAPVTVPAARISELVYAAPHAGSLALWPHGRAADVLFVARRTRLAVSVRASSEERNARITLAVDRTPVARIDPAVAEPPAVVEVGPGWHRFELYRPGDGGRSPVRVEALSFGAGPARQSPIAEPLVLTRETHVVAAASLDPGSGSEVSDGARALWSSGHVGLSILVPDAGPWRLSVRAGGEPCRGEGPRALLMADDDQLAAWRFDSPGRGDRSTEVTLGGGPHRIVLVYDNDLFVPGECDRNLLVEELRFEPVARPG